MHFLWMRKAWGKKANHSSCQVSGIREPSWTAGRQGLEVQIVILHGISREDDIHASDLFQTIDQ